ncbi:hypothetical protein [Modestobacter sp. URMC 112]
MEVLGRLLRCLLLGLAFGAATSSSNAASSPYGPVGSILADSSAQSGVQVASLLLDAGWSWAALAVLSGWIGATRARGAMAAVISLTAATVAYYLTDALVRQEPFTGYWSEMGVWWLAGLVLGTPLGVVGAITRCPGTSGLLAGLVVPVGAAVQMAVLPVGLGGALVPAEAVWARWIVWIAAVTGAALVIAHHRRRATAPPRVDGGSRTPA